MRFLKRQALDRRTANNTTLYSDAARANVYVSPIGQGSLVLPNGPTSAQPSGSTGMMRYDTTTNQVMVYQGSAWRALRFKESNAITQQTLANGNALNTLFGPLSVGTVPSQVQTGSTFGPQNLLVMVENVLQVAVTNYLLSQNPVTETVVSVLANSGSTSLTLSSVVDVNVGDTLTTAAPTTTVSTTVNTTPNTATYASGGVTSTTMLVTGFSGILIVAGQKIVGTGFNSNQYVSSATNTGGGGWTVVLSAVANTQPTGTLTFDVAGSSALLGNNLLVASTVGITAGMYVYGQGFNDDGVFGGSQTTVVSASGNLVVLSSPPDSTPTGTILFTSSAGSTVFAASTTVTSVNTVTNTITINNATTGGIAASRAIQVVRPAGYYLRFTSAVPLGKPVIVLSGFDQ